MGNPDKRMSIIGTREAKPGEKPTAAAWVVTEGAPLDAARELLVMAKSCLLNTGAALPMMSLNTPKGQVMIMPDLDEKLDPPRMALKARGYVRELEATRVVATCTGWLLPKEMPIPVGGRRWRKAFAKGKRPALVGFCADIEQGIATICLQVHEDRFGRPIGFSEPSPDLDTRSVHAHVLNVAPALHGRVEHVSPELAHVIAAASDGGAEHAELLTSFRDGLKQLAAAG